MATLFFFRKHHTFLLLAKWDVFINDKVQISLSPNEMREIKLKEGAYKIQVKSRFIKTNTMNIKIHDDDELYFLAYVDMPYWKQLPLILLFFYFKQGGFLKIAQVDKKVFSDESQNNEGLVWV